MRSVTVTLVIGFILILAFGASGQDQKGDAKPLFIQHLSQGEKVSLKDEDGRFTITRYIGGPKTLPWSVVSVANDHVVIRDVTGITETSIPIYSIKAIVTLRLDGKNP